MAQTINLGYGLKMEIAPFGDRKKIKPHAGLYDRASQGTNLSKYLNMPVTTNTARSYNFSNVGRYAPATSNRGYGSNPQSNDYEDERRRRDRYKQGTEY
jgi:hypothetical protein